MPHMYKGEGIAFDPEGIDEYYTRYCTGDLWLPGG